MYRRGIKRLLDFTLSAAILLILSPLFLALALLVAVFLGRPIFFKQKRSGMYGKKFEMIKFRTMTEAKDENGEMLPDEIRLTKFGRALRSSSLDELPELINIICGDMSIVGPRPLPISYNDYYTEKEKIRFAVRGGLIPPDSIDSSPIISWEKQFEYEADYARNLSFIKDVKIIIGVFRILFKRNKENYGGFVRKSLNEERSLIRNKNSLKGSDVLVRN